MKNISLDEYSKLKMSPLHLLWISGIILSHVWTIDSQCTVLKDVNGTFSYLESSITNYQYRKCWEIPVPTNKLIYMTVEEFEMQFCDDDREPENCNDNNLQVINNGDKTTLCPEKKTSNRHPVTAFSNITVILQSESYCTRKVNFKINYEIRDVECLKEHSFRCSNHSCIPEDQVCNGVENCENGADEVGCDKQRDEIISALAKAMAWLKNKRDLAWGWGEYTSRAVTALYLAGYSNFNGTNLEEELMSKQNELKTALTLSKNMTSNQQLSMFIHALLATCHNPRRFYGQNLVKLLKDQMESSKNRVHPIAYLALCNANETWPGRSTKDLTFGLKGDSKYPFESDIQAFAVMAVSCSTNNPRIKKNPKTVNLMFNKTIERFKKDQIADGSFGTFSTTALVAQALTSSGEQYAGDWDFNNTVKYLVEKLNSSNIEFIEVYYSIPVLIGKSLLNIAEVNCSTNPRLREEEDLVTDIDDYTGPKIRVKYSLFVGDEMDVVYTITLRVPVKYSVFKVMQLAENKDPMFKFEWMKIQKKLYIYKIGKTINDPENGKFWLLYLGSTKDTQELTHYTTNADEIILKEDKEIVLWFKTAKMYE